MAPGLDGAHAFRRSSSTDVPDNVPESHTAARLSVSLLAFGDHLRLPVLLVVIILAGIIGGISPSPGGMGVVEAGLILGLTAAGVSEANATAAVFIQRLFTSYLPSIWGWGHPRMDAEEREYLWALASERILAGTGR